MFASIVSPAVLPPFWRSLKWLYQADHASEENQNRPQQSAERHRNIILENLHYNKVLWWPTKTCYDGKYDVDAARVKWYSPFSSCSRNFKSTRTIMPPTSLELNMDPVTARRDSG